MPKKLIYRDLTEKLKDITRGLIDRPHSSERAEYEKRLETLRRELHNCPTVDGRIPSDTELPPGVREAYQDVVIFYDQHFGEK